MTRFSRLVSPPSAQWRMWWASVQRDCPQPGKRHPPSRRRMFPRKHFRQSPGQSPGQLFPRKHVPQVPARSRSPRPLPRHRSPRPSRPVPSATAGPAVVSVESRGLAGERRGVPGQRRSAGKPGWVPIGSGGGIGGDGGVEHGRSEAVRRYTGIKNSSITPSN